MVHRYLTHQLQTPTAAITLVQGAGGSGASGRPRCFGGRL